MGTPVLGSQIESPFKTQSNQIKLKQNKTFDCQLWGALYDTSDIISMWIWQNWTSPFQQQFIYASRTALLWVTIQLSAATPDITVPSDKEKRYFCYWVQLKHWLSLEITLAHTLSVTLCGMRVTGRVVVSPHEHFGLLSTSCQKVIVCMSCPGAYCMAQGPGTSSVDFVLF